MAVSAGRSPFRTADLLELAELFGEPGQTLRQQTTFGKYLTRRAAEPSYTFRQHLRQLGKAIEE